MKEALIAFEGFFNYKYKVLDLRKYYAVSSSSCFLN